ncbi:MAG: type II toxin-antitoxin system RelE/ParE family toxin [Gammaproteobacteria bacterium]|nr:type II toxin-antitoxin system RelE/ParE family toxin [Gammaproteobacteria bacterium]
MICGFRDKLTEDVFNGLNTRFSRKLPSVLHKKAQRKLDQLNAATKIETLNVPPSNKLAKLEGDLSGFWRIKIDKQWAVIFQWEEGNAHHVSITDYH